MKNQLITNRINELYMAIVSSEKPKTHIRKVISYPNNQVPLYFYVVTICKNERPFIKRVDEFNKLLIDNLNPNEILIYDNDCFCIVSNEYAICYVLEGYKRQANKTGCIINGVVCEKMLYRMGFECAIRYAKKYNVYDLAMNKMNNSEWEEKYPNFADRLVALIKHERGK